MIELATNLGLHLTLTKKSSCAGDGREVEVIVGENPSREEENLQEEEVVRLEQALLEVEARTKEAEEEVETLKSVGPNRSPYTCYPGISLEIESGIATFTCQICRTDLSVGSMKKKLEHLASHFPEELSKLGNLRGKTCLPCGKGFDSPSSALIHVALDHEKLDCILRANGFTFESGIVQQSLSSTPNGKRLTGVEECPQEVGGGTAYGVSIGEKAKLLGRKGRLSLETIDPACAGEGNGRVTKVKEGLIPKTAIKRSEAKEVGEEEYEDETAAVVVSKHLPANSLENCSVCDFKGRLESASFKNHLTIHYRPELMLEFAKAVGDNKCPQCSFRSRANDASRSIIRHIGVFHGEVIKYHKSKDHE